jgi:hypothetical protein
MSSLSPDRVRTSVGIKVAGLFVLTVLAIAFFAFPLGSFAASGNVSVNLVGVVQASQVFGSRAGSINGSLSRLFMAPIDSGEKASQLRGGSFFLFKTNNGHLGIAIAIGPGKGVIEGTTSVISVK